MADPDRLLGGYDPNAGYSAHVAARPKHLPVPSLLRALLSEHLDPGYAAAAAEPATAPGCSRDNATNENATERVVPWRFLSP